MATNSTAVNTCNDCKSSCKTRWHCTVCEDDLCVKCYTKDGHVHEMQQLGVELGEEKKQMDTQESRNDTIRRCILLVEHASKCGDANCCVERCPKMKRIVLHSKLCKRKASNKCAICKTLISMNCYHAKECQDNKCPVPFCLNIKYKLIQQKMAQNRPNVEHLIRQKQDMLGVMNNSAGSSKDWRLSVGQDLRQQYVQKVIQTIMKAIDANNSFVGYAEKVENEVYKSANTREEYYQLLAEKILKIEKKDGAGSSKAWDLSLGQYLRQLFG